jgi:adenine-specific DNA-methyltransferase
MAKEKPPKQVEAFKHSADKRKNNPTVENQAVMPKAEAAPKTLLYPRDTDLDPQLVWRGKDAQDAAELAVQHTPLYIQEKVHPKVLIEDLLAQTQAGKPSAGEQLDLFSDFNGVPEGADKTEFYQHDQNWTNRMILGDSLNVMASLAEREGLRGKVQAIYFDPPYGIKFNSNFQWSTTNREVKDGKADHITREPEQVKAFRDTWRDGIHSYLTYLRDRLTVARDLLTESGSIFVQIGDENVHRVRAVLDEVFGDENFVCEIVCAKTSSSSEGLLSSVADYVLWFAKAKSSTKYRALFNLKVAGKTGGTGYRRLINEWGETRPATDDEMANPASLGQAWRLFASDNITSQRPAQGTDLKEFVVNGQKVTPGKGTFKTDLVGLSRLDKANRLIVTSGDKPAYRRFIDDFPVFSQNNMWTDTLGQNQFGGEKIYVVQTALTIVQRCVLMVTDPGDLVLDPTCGSGTTATVAEQWGRRWITIDTSRVALALARARIMGARYPYYLLADSREGQHAEAELTRSVPSTQPVSGNIRHGFVYDRVPHITLKSIANNAEIDVIWEQWQSKLEPLREQLNTALQQVWQEWEIPREAGTSWPDVGRTTHAAWWQARIARQQEIDKSIAAKAEFEFLYDQPRVDNRKVRVAGPFTVESLSPHRMVGVDADGELMNQTVEGKTEHEARQGFAQMVLDNLKVAGVQQAHKADRMNFTALNPWPGEMICAEGRYEDESGDRRAAIFIGPEFGTVQRADLAEAAREAAEGGFDVLVTCAFNYDAQAADFSKLGALPVLKARMNADLHMAADLKETKAANLFVVFGEPDIEVHTEKDGRIKVEVRGVDVFKPQSGQVESSGTEGIACWFIDTDYNEESFFVRHAYFLGQTKDDDSDPYKALKSSLKAEINPEAWATLYSPISRPFDKPATGRIAVKVINNLGDEVMKVYKV